MVISFGGLINFNYLCNMIGVYQIFNIITEENYIGSSVNIKNRTKHHLHMLRKGIHGNKYLQRVWNKYGEENFMFLPLEFCEKENIIEMEQKWLDYTNPKYNILRIAKSAFGFKHTKENIEKFKELQKILWRNKPEKEKEIAKDRLRNLRKGMTISKEHFEKLMEGHRKAKMWERPEAEERKRKQRINNTLKISKPVLQFTKDGVYIQEFPSVKVAGESIGLKQSQYSTISAVCLGRNGRKQCYGYIWKHKNNEKCLESLI